MSCIEGNLGTSVMRSCREVTGSAENKHCSEEDMYCSKEE
jgi:hypothetical protein